MDQTHLIESLQDQNKLIKRNNDLLYENTKLKKQNDDLQNQINENKKLINQFIQIDKLINYKNNTISQFIKPELSKDELKFRDDPNELSINYYIGNTTQTRGYYYKSNCFSTKNLTQIEAKKFIRDSAKVFELRNPYVKAINDYKYESSIKVLKKLSKNYPSIKEYVVVPQYHEKFVPCTDSSYSRSSMLVSKNELFHDFPILRKYEKDLFPMYKYDDYTVSYIINTHKFEQLIAFRAEKYSQFYDETGSNGSCGNECCSLTPNTLRYYLINIRTIMDDYLSL